MCLLWGNRRRRCTCLPLGDHDSVLHLLDEVDGFRVEVLEAGEHLGALEDWSCSSSTIDRPDDCPGHRGVPAVSTDGLS